MIGMEKAEVDTVAHKPWQVQLLMAGLFQHICIRKEQSSLLMGLAGAEGGGEGRQDGCQEGLLQDPGRGPAVRGPGRQKGAATSHGPHAQAIVSGPWALHGCCMQKHRTRSGDMIFPSKQSRLQGPIYCRACPSHRLARDRSNRPLHKRPTTRFPLVLHAGILLGGQALPPGQGGGGRADARGS